MGDTGSVRRPRTDEIPVRSVVRTCINNDKVEVSTLCALNSSSVIIDVLGLCQSKQIEVSGKSLQEDPISCYNCTNIGH